ncbi:MAG: helix-turn-helix transcriptional regulator [Synergistaceae bacterium]|nr:helix-turn-helix transcriptional regulator [Synergistaceae bacterium]
MKYLKHYREEKGLTQSALAEMVGISRFSIMDYENCSKSPTLETARKIASALGVELDFLDGSKNPTPPLPEQEQGNGVTE